MGTLLWQTTWPWPHLTRKNHANFMARHFSPADTYLYTRSQPDYLRYKINTINNFE